MTIDDDRRRIWPFRAGGICYIAALILPTQLQTAMFELCGARLV